MAHLLLCFKPRNNDRNDSEPSSPRHPHTRRDQPACSSESGVSQLQELRKTVAFVELLKHKSEPLGLVLKGGADCNKPVYVGQLHPGGVAEKSGALQIGDHIRGINGTATDHLNQSEANALLNNSGNVINLEIEFEALPGSDIDSGTVKKTAFIKLKRERNGFGFSVSGGQAENRPITVSNVAVGSMAFKNGCLKAGDRILKISRNDVTKATMIEALNHLKASGEECVLEIEYDVTLHEDLSEYSGQLLVELLKPKGAAMGISLEESPAPGGPLIISKVKQAGISDRCGALHCGDRLLSLNKESLVGKPIADVQRMLKYCNLNVELEIIPAHNFPQAPEAVAGDAATHISRVRPASSYDSQSVISYSSLATTNMITTHPETMVVQLEADEIGYGMRLKGGAVDRGVYPITIASIEEGGPAAKLGQLQVRDQILSIDGIKVHGYSLQEVLKLVHEADNVIEIEVMFDVQDAAPPNSGTFNVRMKKTASLNLGITINGSRSRGDTIWISSLKKGGIAYRSGMLHSGDVIMAINGQSLENCNLREAAQILMNAGEEVSLTIAKESTPPPAASETIIYSVELQRNQQSLGITLTGSRDQAGHPIVISKIKEDGVAHKTGTLKVGDRVLAINGERLYNKTVLEAVRMLNSAGDVVSLKISKAATRRKSRHKSGSPTGKHRGHYHDHRGMHMYRGSFGSSGSSNLVRPGLGPTGGYRGQHYHKSNFRSRLMFEPVLGESASGCNTPDNVSISSSYGGQRGSHGVVGNRLVDRLTPTSEVSGSAFTPTGSSISGVPHHWHHRVPALENNQPLPHFPGRNGWANYHPSPHLSESLSGSDLHLMVGRHPHPFVGRGSKRDSSTDDELSMYDEFDGGGRHNHHNMPRTRRASLSDKPPHPSQYSNPPYLNGQGRWGFKSHRPMHKPYIPVGRVSPITPTETDRMISPYPQQLKGLEDSLQFKTEKAAPLPPPPSLPSGNAVPPSSTNEEGSPQLSSVKRETEEETPAGGNDVDIEEREPNEDEGIKTSNQITEDKAEEMTSKDSELSVLAASPVNNEVEMVPLEPSPLPPESADRDTLGDSCPSTGDNSSPHLLPSSESAPPPSDQPHPEVPMESAMPSKSSSANKNVNDEKTAKEYNNDIEAMNIGNDISTGILRLEDHSESHKETPPNVPSLASTDPHQSGYLNDKNSNAGAGSPPISSLRRHAAGNADTNSKHRHRTDHSPPPRKPMSSSSSSTPVTDKNLEQQISVFKETIVNADKFDKVMSALAAVESGSSDQDSDSESHSKMLDLPPHEHAMVTKKMRVSQSTVLQTIVIKKNREEVSFGFSIADGQYDMGVYVKTVKPGGPSDRGGLMHYDKICKVNDVMLQPEHKSSNVYPLLKKYENELVLTVKRSQTLPPRLGDKS